MSLLWNTFYVPQHAQPSVETKWCCRGCQHPRLFIPAYVPKPVLHITDRTDSGSGEFWQDVINYGIFSVALRLCSCVIFLLVSIPRHAAYPGCTCLYQCYDTPIISDFLAPCILDYILPREFSFVISSTMESTPSCNFSSRHLSTLKHPHRLLKLPP